MTITFGMWLFFIITQSIITGLVITLFAKEITRKP